MTGRCAGCGLTDKNADTVREHTRYCLQFKALYDQCAAGARPGDGLGVRALDPEAEFIRWRDEDRSLARAAHRESVIGEADRRRAEQKARWVTPADILADDDFPVVCENGCPEGYLGRHKFSCSLARGEEGQ